MAAERFIPFRKTDIVHLCENALPETQSREDFAKLCTLLTHRIHFEYHQRLEHLKDNYAPFDPDRATRILAPTSKYEQAQSKRRFVTAFTELLDAANFEKVTEQDLLEALNEESLFKVRLAVSFDDFEEVVFYRRGESKQTETLRSFFGLRKKHIAFTNYDRVAIYITFKGESHFANHKKAPVGYTPGSTIVKLFQNVPKADLEMLFPNSEVRMRPIDKVVIGGSAAIGGIAILVTRLGASLLLLASLLGFWLGLSEQKVEVNSQHLITFGVGMGVFGGFVLREWNKFKNRKIRFMKALSDNLYFKNLDNNAGVFYRLLDVAEEEDCKEAILAYTFLLKYPKGLTEAALDQQIERWFKETQDCELDFDVTDALQKLLNMQLVTCSNQYYFACPQKDAIRILDDHWDNIE